MEIVNYSDHYFLDVVKLVENFHKEAIGQYDDLFDPNALIKTIKANKDTNAGNAFLLIIDEVCEGMLFGQKIEVPFNNRIIFQEVIWYVNQAHRRYGMELLRAAKKKLKSDGVSFMIMVALESSMIERLDKYYKKIGFKPLERHYMAKL